MIKSIVKICSAAAILLMAVGCESTQLSAQASQILLSPNPPPKGCHYLGLITGNQGNFFTGGFTSNKNLEQGAINDLRNQAANLNANYVQMVTNRAGISGGGLSMGGSANQQQTNVTVTGNAYRCAKIDT